MCDSGRAITPMSDPDSCRLHSPLRLFPGPRPVGPRRPFALPPPGAFPPRRAALRCRCVCRSLLSHTTHGEEREDDRKEHPEERTRRGRMEGGTEGTTGDGAAGGEPARTGRRPASPAGGGTGGRPDERPAKGRTADGDAGTCPPTGTFGRVDSGPTKRRLARAKRQSLNGSSLPSIRQVRSFIRSRRVRRHRVRRAC